MKFIIILVAVVIQINSIVSDKLEVTSNASVAARQLVKNDQAADLIRKLANAAKQNETKHQALRVYVIKLTNGIRQRQLPSFRMLPTEDESFIGEVEDTKLVLNSTMRSIYNIAYSAGRNLLKYIVNPIVDDYTGGVKNTFLSGYNAGKKFRDIETHEESKFLAVKRKLPGNLKNLFQLAFNLGQMFGQDGAAAERIDELLYGQDEASKFIASVAYGVGVYYNVIKHDLAVQTRSVDSEFKLPTEWKKQVTRGLSENAKGLFYLGHWIGGWLPGHTPIVAAMDITLYENLSEIQKVFFNTGYMIASNYDNV